MIKVLTHTLTYGNPIPEIVPGSASVVFADPPYNFGVKYADDSTGDKLPPGQYETWCSDCIKRLASLLKPGGTLWWLCPPSHVSFIPMLGEEIIGPQLYMIVKTETFAQYQQKTLTEDYRLLFCFQRPGGPLTFNPDAIRIPSKRQEMNDKRADSRGRVPGQIWEIRRLQGTSDDHVDWHPAQLPPELLHRIVNGWSNPGDLIVDAFAGSGNMGLACRQLKRDAVLIDASPTYCQKMRERLKLG